METNEYKELQSYKTKVGFGLILLLGSYALISFSAVLEQIELPLRFTFKELIAAVILIGLIELICDFGEKNERHHIIVIDSLPQSGTIIKHGIYIISVFLAYSAYRDLVLPYLGTYSWVYPLVFGIIFFYLVFDIYQNIHRQSEVSASTEAEVHKPEDNISEAGTVTNNEITEFHSEKEEESEALEPELEIENYQGEITYGPVIENLQKSVGDSEETNFEKEKDKGEEIDKDQKHGEEKTHESHESYENLEEVKETDLEIQENKEDLKEDNIIDQNDVDMEADTQEEPIEDIIKEIFDEESVESPFDTSIAGQKAEQEYVETDGTKETHETHVDQEIEEHGKEVEHKKEVANQEENEQMGQSVEQSRVKCENCGTTLKYGTVFCTNCFGS